MANKRIFDLTAGVPQSTYIAWLESADGVTDIKVDLSTINAATKALAEAHSDIDNTHGAIGLTPVKLEGYDSSLVATGVTVTLTTAGTSNTASFTIQADKDGIYRVTTTIDVKSPATNENVDFVINVNGVPTPFKASVDMTNASVDGGVASINTFINLVATDVVEVYANSDGSTFNDLLIDSLTFTIEKT